MFYLKVKVRPNPQKPSEVVSVVSWLEAGVAYPIIDVYKYLQHNKDTGISAFRTWFLVGNDKTGVMGWVEAAKADFAGYGDKVLNLTSSIAREEVEEEAKKEEVNPEPQKPVSITFSL